jgi:membrane protein implicated in regulation of membrane protease activity
MTQTLWWIAIAVACALIEVISLDLVLLMLAGGALAGAGMAALGTPVWAQILVALVVAVALLAALRPWLIRNWRKSKNFVETNAAALVGRTALAVSAVGPVTGRVKLAGEVWSARTEVPDLEISEGANVRVVRIDGATAVVEPLS